MKIYLRLEEEKDYKIVENITREAFEKGYSKSQERFKELSNKYL
jgi:predicted N-acetyltransferase YhbS